MKKDKLLMTIITELPVLPDKLRGLKDVYELFTHLQKALNLITNFYSHYVRETMKWCDENNYDYDKVSEELCYGDISKNFVKCRKEQKNGKNKKR